MGIFGSKPSQQQAPSPFMAPPEVDMATPAQAPKRKGGIFGGMDQNKWLMLATVLGGGRNTMPLQIMMQQRQAEQDRLAAQQDREARFQDWQRQFDYERANPKPTQQQPYRFEDNVGNVHEIGPDGKPRLLYADPTPKMYIQGDRAIQIPNPFANQGPKAGDVVNGHRFKGGNPSDRNSWEPVTQDAGGSTMTQAQYGAFVQAVGEQAARNHINKYGIRVAN